MISNNLQSGNRRRKHSNPSFWSYARLNLLNHQFGGVNPSAVKQVCQIVLSGILHSSEKLLMRKNM